MKSIDPIKFRGRQACVVAVLSFTTFASAMSEGAFVTPGFSGTTSTDGWTAAGNLNQAANPGFPASTTDHANAWLGSIGSDIGADATLSKLSGGGYPPGNGGIYTHATPGTFQIADATAVSGLATVLFQINVTGGPRLISPTPVLNYNGGSQNGLAPVISSTVGLESLYQWDLSAVPSITSFNVDFGLGAVNQFFALQLDQGSVFTPVPEPASIALASLAAVALAVKVRRGKRTELLSA